jgi:hypothetical protein
MKIALYARVSNASSSRKLISQGDEERQDPDEHLGYRQSVHQTAVFILRSISFLPQRIAAAPAITPRTAPTIMTPNEKWCGSVSVLFAESLFFGA